MKSQGQENGYWHYRIAIKVDWRLRIGAANASISLQLDCISLNPFFATSHIARFRDETSHDVVNRIQNYSITLHRWSHVYEFCNNAKESGRHAVRLASLCRRMYYTIDISSCQRSILERLFGCCQGFASVDQNTAASVSDVRAWFRLQWNGMEWKGREGKGREGKGRV